MESIVESLESVMAARDPYTVAHQQRVTQLSLAIAEETAFKDLAKVRPLLPPFLTEEDFIVTITAMKTCPRQHLAGIGQQHHFECNYNPDV